MNPAAKAKTKYTPNVAIISPMVAVVSVTPYRSLPSTDFEKPNPRKRINARKKRKNSVTISKKTIKIVLRAVNVIVRIICVSNLLVKGM